MTPRERIINRLEVAISYLDAVESKPKVMDLYYPIKRVNASGWEYHVSFVNLEDLKMALAELKKK